MHFRVAVIHHAPDFALITFDFYGAAVDIKLAAIESADTGPTGVHAATHRQQG
jgi:hypothetical protein